MRISLRHIGMLLCAALAAALTAGCAEERTPTGTTTAEPKGAAGMTTTGQEGRQAQMAPGQILGIATTINQAEVEAARYVSQNATQPEVQQLASRIEREHEQALQQERQLAQRNDIQIRTDHPTVRELQNEHQQMMQQLRDARGEEIGRMYVSAQTAMHRRALRIVEEQLLPAAEGEVANHLRQYRGHIASHMTELEDMQRQLGAPPMSQR